MNTSTSANSFLGGVFRPELRGRLQELGLPLAGKSESVANPPGRLLPLTVQGEDFHHWRNGDYEMVVRGWISPTTHSADRAGVASEIQLNERIRCEDGKLWSQLDGSFSLLHIDRQRERLSLYRNLMGSGFTYYVEINGDFVCSNNLRTLVAFLRKLGWQPVPNRQRLPVFFIYRFVPGRETLLSGVYRLMPGELLQADRDGIRRRQVQSLADLVATPIAGRDALAALEDTMDRVLRDCARHPPPAANTLSGGIDSTYIQAKWNQLQPPGGQVPPSFGIHVPHPKTEEDTHYAQTAAEALHGAHRLVRVEEPYGHYLERFIAATGEPPNHVQTAYFEQLAREMVAAGFPHGLCGEGADSLFGVGATTEIQTAQFVRKWIPLPAARSALQGLVRMAGKRRLALHIALAESIRLQDCQAGYLRDVACYTHWEAVERCFGQEQVANAIDYRRQLLEQYQVPPDFLGQLHAIGYLGEAIDSASLWTTLFNAAGGDLFCPFLDSRMLRFAINLPPEVRFPFRRPKGLLREALQRYVPRSLIERRKRGFGQPIFEWLGPGGALHRRVQQIDQYDFVDPAIFRQSVESPNWFLYSLLCYDVWYKQFCSTSGPPHACGRDTP